MNKLALAETTLAALAVLAVPGLPKACHAQGMKDAYARADGLRDLTTDKVFKTRVEPHWFGEGGRFWYRNDLRGGAREFVIVDAAEGTRRPAFDHAKVAEALTRATGKPHEATRLPVDRIEVAADGAIRFEADGGAWRYDVEADSLGPGEPLARSPQPERPRREGRRPPGSRRSAESPDGKWAVFLKGRDLHLRAKESGEEFALTDDGTDDDRYESGVFWSPDSTKLVALRTKQGDDRRVYLIESSPTDQLQPKLHSYDYLKPGDRRPVTKPHRFDVATREEVPVRDDLFANPWSIGEYRWSPDSSRFTFLFNQRGHQVLRVVAVDATTGEAKAIIDEASETFIDYSQKTFSHDVDGTGEIIWMSERDGWNHLYLYDGGSGRLKNQITSGDWVVRGVDRVDDEGRRIWFRAGGIRPGPGCETASSATRPTSTASIARSRSPGPCGASGEEADLRPRHGAPPK